MVARTPSTRRHAEIHQHDVGTVLGDRGGHLVAVGGLPDDRDVVGLAEHQPQAGAHERVVVDEEHADRGRVGHRGSMTGQGTRTATRKRSWSGPREST